MRLSPHIRTIRNPAQRVAAVADALLTQWGVAHRTLPRAVYGHDTDADLILDAVEFALTCLHPGEDVSLHEQELGTRWGLALRVVDRAVGNLPLPVSVSATHGRIGSRADMPEIPRYGMPPRDPRWGLRPKFQPPFML